MEWSWIGYYIVIGNGMYRVGVGFKYDVGSFGNGFGCIDNVVY